MIWCLLMAAVNLWYTHITMKQQAATNTMPGMKFMMYAMPIFMLFALNSYSSGLNYYYFLSMCITIIQMWAIRKFTDEDKIILQKYQPACVFCNNADRVVYFNNKRICQDCLEKIKTQL